MSRPVVFHDSEYVGCVVDGKMAQGMRGAATRNGLSVSTFIRRALDAAIAADLVAQLGERARAA